MKDRELPPYGSHKGVPDNEKTDQVAKEALDKLKKWLTEEDFKKRDQKWKNGNNEMKERKPDVDRKEDTKGMPTKEHVAISRPLMAPRWKGSVVHYVPSVTPIYLSTTHCGNAKKLRTREHEKGTMDQREKRYRKDT
jgi:hypothetical protein